jgi:hypothetical protein
MVIHCRAEV